MDWLALESRMFTATAYAAERQVLWLRFVSGDVYRYFGFQAERFADFLNAESHGRYFLAHIRDQFRYERLARLQAVTTS